MSIRTERHTGVQGGVTRQELLAAAAEVAALFLVFIVAFTGRDTWSDAMKTFLTVLSVAVGGIGAGAGGWVSSRAIASPHGRLARIGLGAFMIFIGVYTIVHVLS